MWPPSPWHLFTHLLTNSTFNVSRIVELKSFDIHYMSFPHAPYKLLPSIKNILGTRCFFFYFLSHNFLWAYGSLCEPRKFSLFVHSLVCQITHSFLNGFQPNLCQHFSHVCSTCHTIFSLKQHLNVFEKGYYTAGY